MRRPRTTLVRRARRGFVLLEVILALMILGISLAALMRSFTQSLSAVRLLEVQTQAQFFAEQLLHEFEINPPEDGRAEGGFGDEYHNYSFRVEVQSIEPKYRRIDGAKAIKRFFPMRQMLIEIVYDDGDPRRDPIVPVRLTTAIVGFEKFSPMTKRSYELY